MFDSVRKFMHKHDSRKVRVFGALGTVLVIGLVTAIVLLSSGSGSVSAAAPKNDGNTGSLNKEASAWVTALVTNFKGAQQVPAECQSWSPDVNLSEVHFYTRDKDKESPTAFGPDMGNTPCTVSISLVERMYRDPALELTEAQRLQFVDFKPEDQASQIAKLQSDPTQRRVLANKILGWYANPVRTLAIQQYSGRYSSDVMSSNGTTSPVTSSKDSTVLSVYDMHGKVVTQRRLNCGMQGFVPHTPPLTPPPPTPKPFCVTHPTAPECLTPKNPALDPLRNPQVPDQVKGPGSTPVGTNPGPATPTYDTPTGCQSTCPGGGPSSGPTSTPTPEPVQPSPIASDPPNTGTVSPPPPPPPAG